MGHRKKVGTQGGRESTSFEKGSKKKKTRSGTGENAISREIQSLRIFFIGKGGRGKKADPVGIA